MPPEIELLPDGSYRTRRPPVAARIFAWAIVIAVLAAALAVAAFALWFALILIPVVIWRRRSHGWRSAIRSGVPAAAGPRREADGHLGRDLAILNHQAHWLHLYLLPDIPLGVGIVGDHRVQFRAILAIRQQE